MIDETSEIDKIIQQINDNLKSNMQLDELSKLAYLLYDTYGFRPIYLDSNINQLIGRNFIPNNQFQREEINPDFFRNTDRIKYLLEYIRIKPILTVLKKDSFILPKDRIGDLNVYMQQIFENYLQDLNTLPQKSIFTELDLDAVSDLCKSINEAIGEYYNGFPSSAYEYLDKGMEVVTRYSIGFFNEEPRTQYLYRIRCGSNHTFSRKEMFHVPFELRGLVNTQRYSIPGLPCLYLGSSAYVCWEELNKPDLNTIQTSMFVRKQDRVMKLLDIGYPPKVIQEYIDLKMCSYYGTTEWDRFIEEIRSYLVIWPLIAACSIRVLNRTDAFKPEYIIPQLLLQWIRSSPKFDGICYFSVASKTLNNQNFHLFLNYAVPTKSNKLQGHCDYLKDLFWATNAVPWQLYKIYKDSGSSYDILAEQSVDFEPIIGTKVMYGRTDFAKLEVFLRSQRPE